MTEYPYIPWFVSDWLADSAVTRLQPASRGIWFDACCVMWEEGRTGVLSGPTYELAKLTRCTPDEFTAAAHDLQKTKAADVTFSNGHVTLINRRMQREARKRLAGAERVQKWRSKQDQNATIPHPYPTPCQKKYKKREKGHEDIQPKIL